MFDKKMQIMSFVDLIQLLGRARGMFSSFFAHKGEAAATKPEAKAEAKGDENLPTGLITEKFTRVDESHWQQLMLYVTAPVADTTQKIVTEMKGRDEKDGGSRVDSFRIGILIMPNKQSEEVVTKVTGGTTASRRRAGGAPSGPVTEETTVRKIDPRFTADDSRAKYLAHLTSRIQTDVASGKPEADAIEDLVDSLEDDGFVVTGAVLQKAKKLANKTAGAMFEETLRFRLGDEYDAIKQRHPKASPKQLRELRLCALRARENYRTQEVRAGTRKALTEKNMVIIAVPVIITVIAVIGGLIYNIFNR